MLQNNVRILVSLAALAALVSGCATQPAEPPVTKQVKVDAANVAEVQRAGYKVVNKDGQKLYCRTDLITGSHVRTKTQCLTEQELYDQMEGTKQSMSQRPQGIQTKMGNEAPLVLASSVAAKAIAVAGDELRISLGHEIP